MIFITTPFASRFADAGPPCSSGDFFSFPTWYKYLPSVVGSNPCAPKISSINDVWLIIAAVIEILLRVGALAAIAMVVYGGISFITSEGQPEKTAKAIKIIINAVVGLAITIVSAGVVTFLAGRFN